jgi:hypothetical protein
LIEPDRIPRMNCRWKTKLSTMTGSETRIAAAESRLICTRYPEKAPRPSVMGWWAGRAGHRQVDPPELRPRVGTVDPGRFAESARDRAERGAHPEGAEADAHAEVGEDDSLVRVGQVVGEEVVVQRDDERFHRQHEAEQHERGERQNPADPAERPRAARVVTDAARQGDHVAIDIVREQGRRLAFYAEIAAGHAGLRDTGGPVPVALSGSILRQAHGHLAAAVLLPDLTTGKATARRG